MQSESSQNKSLTLGVAALTCILGLAASLYSLNHHYQVKDSGQTQAACNISETLNCDAAASSVYSEVLGIPLGGFGFAFFLSFLFLALSGHSKFNVRFLTLGLGKDKKPGDYSSALLPMGFIGVLVSLALGLISHFKVGSLCPTCMFIYVLTAVLFVCAVLLNRPISKLDIGKGVAAAMLTVIPSIAVLAATYAHNKLRAPSTTETQISDSATTTAPSSQKFNIPIATSPYHGFGEDYRKGSDSAKVTLVEFADFQCPACQSLSFALNSIQKQFGNDVRIVFKNFPLHRSCNPAVNIAGHQHACKVAVMARCAGQYGKFWEYHDLAFARQRQLTDGVPEAWGKDIGLTDDQIKTCLDSKDLLNKIAADGKLGDQVQVNATPTLYINGYKYEGSRNPEAIGAAILKLL